MDDPIVAQLDVYVAAQLAPYLHILQVPESVEEAEVGRTSMNSRYKKNSKVMELELPLDRQHSTYSAARGEELMSSSLSGRIKVQGSADEGRGGGQLSSIKLAGSQSLASQEAMYFVAVCQDGGAKDYTSYFFRRNPHDAGSDDNFSQARTRLP